MTNANDVFDALKHFRVEEYMFGSRRYYNKHNQHIEKASLQLNTPTDTRSGGLTATPTLNPNITQSLKRWVTHNDH